MKASIVINNYNYDRYLARAIRSAVEQEGADCEVIVVDDESRDTSVARAQEFGDQIKLIARQHEGQIATVNAGVRVASGDIIFLLDSDDAFDTDKVRQVLDVVRQRGIEQEPFVLYHPMRIIDGSDVPLPGQMPQQVKKIESLFPIHKQWSCISTPQDAVTYVRRHGFPPFLGSGPSCLALSRSMVDLLFPLPYHSDAYVDTLIVRRAIAVGNLYCLNRQLGNYRAHGDNSWYGKHQKAVQRRYFTFLRANVSAIQKIYKQQGMVESLDIYASGEAWRYFQRMDSARGIAGVSMRMLKRSWYWKNIIYALWGVLEVVRLKLQLPLR